QGGSSDHGRDRHDMNGRRTASLMRVGGPRKTTSKTEYGRLPGALLDPGLVARQQQPGVCDPILQAFDALPGGNVIGGGSGRCARVVDLGNRPQSRENDGGSSRLDRSA